jgi:hypothetical protein
MAQPLIGLNGYYGISGFQPSGYTLNPQGAHGSDPPPVPAPPAPEDEDK